MINNNQKVKDFPTTFTQIKCNSVINKTKGDGKPLFMYLAFQVAHSPFMAPAESIGKYDKIYSAGWDKIRELRFEKQKELGMWPANMTLPNERPPNVPWTSLTSEEKQYATRFLQCAHL